MHIIIKIIDGLGMGCFYLYQWLLPEPPSEINYSFHAFFLCNDLLETGGILSVAILYENHYYHFDQSYM